MYKPSVSFVERSNQEKKWCQVHPLGFWGKDQFGNWYTRCAVGNRMNEDCKELEEKYVAQEGVSEK